MRLLECRDDGDFRLTAFQDDNTPPYAILSHTWVEGQEVTFEDLTAGTGKEKKGNKKIRFCGEQARQDGLQYFWVDTCCINKANYAELLHSINSMFRWYRNATRCYVYLSDLSVYTFDGDDERNPQPWESDFRRCKWFTRGWTLQELLAPSSVEFFSCESKRVGDKSSLENQIHDITGIPKSALQGARLSQFSDKDRFSWIQLRRTTVEEDKAYALLGIFDVHIPPRYGEGMANAFRRLEEEIDKLNTCLQDLRLTNPRYDKKRIQDTKGGLLADSYHWILENPSFQQWRNDKQSRLLWIKGDPGKGKTMLLCGIVDELNKSTAGSPLLSYFFCQATDSRINKATAVLRGLIYMLVTQQPSLISYIREEYEKAGKMLFEDANALVVMSEMLTNILHDSTLQTTYLIIDALDECEENRPELLAFVAQNSSVSSRVKWIVSSRNWPDIEEQITTANQKVKVSLELNEKSISAAVKTYIEWKIEQLVEQKGYDNDTRDSVHRYLLLNANNTFLWVALVCQQLADPKVRQHHTLAKLDAFPPGLNDLYGRMMGQIHDSADVDLCTRILAVVSVVYRPITLDELESFVDMPTGASLTEIIQLCGSFLTLQEQTVSFVHQSAKEYLVNEADSELFPLREEHIQHCIFSRSIQVMDKVLQQNILKLDHPAILVNEIKPPDPDPLAAIRYSCVYWVEHLRLIPDQVLDYEDTLSDTGAIFTFFKRHFLHWLEVLGLIKRVSESITIIDNLLAIVDVSRLLTLIAVHLLYLSNIDQYIFSPRKVIICMHLCMMQSDLLALID
jgi:hypothetical protein